MLYNLRHFGGFIIGAIYIHFVTYIIVILTFKFTSILYPYFYKHLLNNLI